MVDKILLTKSKVQSGSALDNSSMEHIFFLNQTEIDESIKSEEENNAELLDIRSGYNRIRYDRAGTAVREQVKILHSRINALSKLKEGSTTGDAELFDGRIDYEGKQHETIGESIRSQYGSLSERLTAEETNNFEFNQRLQKVEDGYTKHYSTVATMKADLTLLPGDKVVTLGYWSINDGDGATYYIRGKDLNDVDDGVSIHFLALTHLVAELIVENSIVLKSNNGTKYRIKVSDDGVLSTIKI